VDDHSEREGVMTMAAVLNLDIRNTTDATRGLPLPMRVLHRKNELEDVLADLGHRDVLLRTAIETALATAYSLLTGDFAHPSDVVAREMNRWLERHKHLAQEITRAQRR